MNARYLTLIVLAMLIVPALGIPSTPSVSGITGGNATFTSAGASTTCWFQWGSNSANPEWTTPNTTTSGSCVATQYGSPYYPNQNYYVQCCDVTGCSAITSFTSGASTPISVPTLGAAFQNVTNNNYNIVMIITQLPAPLLWEFSQFENPMALALLAALFLMFYFIGLWLRQRRVELPVLLFMILVAFVLTPQLGFNWGLPPEFAEVAQMACYVCLAGMVVSLFKKG